MCAYSMIADHYKDMWTTKPFYNGLYGPTLNGVSRAEFDDLKRQVEEMKELLKRAIKYDADNGEPECEMAEKVAILKKVADLVGVDLSEVLQSK